MRTAFLFALIGTSTLVWLAAPSIRALGEAKAYPLRWVYVSTELDTEQELDRVEGIAQTASEHGVNGMLLSGGFDALDLKDAAYRRRLRHLKQTCDRRSVEIIPLGFSVGYGGGILAHDKNLAAGLPVKGALFVAGEHEARFQADPPVELEGGEFEGPMRSFTPHKGQITIDERHHVYDLGKQVQAVAGLR